MLVLNYACLTNLIFIINYFDFQFPQLIIVNYTTTSASLQSIGALMKSIAVLLVLAAWHIHGFEETTIRI